MTLEELADLIRANSANTNGRIDGVVERVDGVADRVEGVFTLVDGVVDHVRDLHDHIDRAQNETNATLINLQNDFTDVRGEIKEMKTDVAEVRRSLDLAGTVAAMRREIDTLTAEVAELKRRAS
jgi:prophage DNA circulation protein